jgi:hypothetical protein
MTLKIFCFRVWMEFADSLLEMIEQMAELILAARSLPVAFRQYTQLRFQRTVRLTREAIAKLEAAGTPVTLTAVAETTRDLDEGGKGITPMTILRNTEARDLFHQHSRIYQERQLKARKAKRKRSGVKVDADARATYRGLRTSDLIQMVENLKQQLAEANARLVKLQAERDEAYRLRDEALQQNTRQLAALTKVSGQVQSAVQQGHLG